MTRRAYDEAGSLVEKYRAFLRKERQLEGRHAALAFKTSTRACLWARVEFPGFGTGHTSEPIEIFGMKEKAPRSSHKLCRTPMELPTSTSLSPNLALIYAPSWSRITICNGVFFEENGNGPVRRARCSGY